MHFEWVSMFSKCETEQPFTLQLEGNEKITCSFIGVFSLFL